MLQLELLDLAPKTRSHLFARRVAPGKLSGQQQLIIRLVGAGGLAEELQQLLYGEVFLLFPGYVYRHMAVVHHDQPVAVGNGITHIVGDHHGGQVVLFHDPLGGLQHLCGGLGVQGGGVLVQQQQLRLTKWVLYVVIIVLCLVIQDTVMCRLPLLGATTDLPVAAILLITVTEGTEVGSLFILIASVLYYFSGTAPGPYCIGLMSVFGIFATMVRQMYWHRSRGSLTISAMLALVCYELGLFVTGLLMGLTYWGRLRYFLLTCLYTCLIMIPLYSLINKTGLIGGNTWKE